MDGKLPVGDRAMDSDGWPAESYQLLVFEAEVISAGRLTYNLEPKLGFCCAVLHGSEHSRRAGARNSASGSQWS